jgi:hypothetical protein
LVMVSMSFELLGAASSEACGPHTRGWMGLLGIA